MSSNTDNVFRTLADSTRRQILDLLAERGPLSVGQLAAEFPDLVSSGISKHLMSLRGAHLVSAARQGRQQIYRLEPRVLAAGLAPWMAKYEKYWTPALERLRELATEAATEDRVTSRKDHPRKRRKRNHLSTAGIVNVPTLADRLKKGEVKE